MSSTQGVTGESKSDWEKVHTEINPVKQILVHDTLWERKEKRYLWCQVFPYVPIPILSVSLPNLDLAVRFVGTICLGDREGKGKTFNIASWIGSGAWEEKWWSIPGRPLLLVEDCEKCTKGNFRPPFSTMLLLLVSEWVSPYKLCLLMTRTTTVTNSLLLYLHCLPNVKRSQADNLASKQASN